MIPRFLTDNIWCGGEIEEAGTLFLPTGRIVVSDPILDPFSKPFTLAVPPGAYPIRFNMVGNDIGLVMVDFADGLSKVASWRTTEPANFGVDSATGCIMDHKVSRFLRRKAEDGKYEKFALRFERAMAENCGSWGSYCLDLQSGANVILFKTFGGDGTFPSYFGFDENGEPGWLVIDMFFGENDEDREQV